MTTPQTLEGLKAGLYAGTTSLKLNNCDISSFPSEILTLFPTLEHLDLSSNPLSTLPKDITRLHKLKRLFLSSCNFTTFPTILSQMRSLEMIAFKSNSMTTIPPNSFPRKLRWLILTNNEITSLPESIGSCVYLQKCMLAGNKLTSLPNTMAKCQKLGLLRLSSNELKELPHWLFTLPELSFLSYAGNPCSKSLSDIPAPVLDTITWSDLQVHQTLGEGASGIISKGTWNRQILSEEIAEHHVAIKLFKGEVTSDGSPMDEMNACILAGKHSNLIDPLGKIHGHPSTSGLVLQLIPPHYTNLGFPPSFTTCTRDTFPSTLTLPLEVVKSILIGIASAALHLHERGIAHGDLYAHNILIDSSGHALLGDFGAATIYDRKNDVKGLFERMEMLAFGHLVEDLLGLVVRGVRDGGGEEGVWDEKEGGEIEGLNGVHWRCTDPVVEGRPGFGEVVGLLEGL